MSEIEAITEERRALRNYLQDTVGEQRELGGIALALAKAIHQFPMDNDKKRAGLGFVRAWADYAREHEVPDDNPYAVRYHVAQFAAQELGEQHTYETLEAVDLSRLEWNGASYADLISSHASADILSDPDIAIVGGAARLALKIYAGVDVRAELPVHDIDAVITSKTDDVAAKASSYGVDITGAKIVDGDVRQPSTVLQPILTAL